MHMESEQCINAVLSVETHGTYTPPAVENPYCESGC